MEDNFLTQLVREPSRGGSLDLLFTEKDWWETVVRSLRGHSTHKMIELSILDEVTRGVSKTVILTFQKADFGLLGKLVWRVP